MLLLHFLLCLLLRILSHKIGCCSQALYVLNVHLTYPSYVCVAKMTCRCNAAFQLKSYTNYAIYTSVSLKYLFILNNAIHLFSYTFVHFHGRCRFSL